MEETTKTTLEQPAPTIIQEEKQTPLEGAAEDEPSTQRGEDSTTKTDESEKLDTDGSKQISEGEKLQEEGSQEKGVEGIDTDIEHPLQNAWTLWYDNPRKRTSQDTWGSHLRKIIDFDTVEMFWRAYNNILPPSRMDHGSNYHLFKKDIEPKWEDKENERGGQWNLIIHRKDRERLDKMWLWTILALVGETIEESDEICGCVVSVRKNQDRIAIWTKNAAKETTQRSIGRQWKSIVELSTAIEYQVHSDSLRNISKPRYEV